MKEFNVFSKRYLIILILFVTLNTFISGCYSLRTFDRTDVTITKVYKIETLEGEIIDFRETELGYAVLSTTEIVGFDENGEQKLYPVSTIKKMYTEKFDFVFTFFSVVGIIGGIFLVLILVINAGGGLSLG